MPTYQFPLGMKKQLPDFCTDVDTNLHFERIRLECGAIIQGLIEPENGNQLIANSLRMANQ